MGAMCITIVTVSVKRSVHMYIYIPKFSLIFYKIVELPSQLS